MKKTRHNKILYTLSKPFLSLYFLFRYNFWAKAKRFPGKKGYLVFAKRSSFLDPILVRLAVRGKLIFANDDFLFTPSQNLLLSKVGFGASGKDTEDIKRIEEYLDHKINVCYLLDESDKEGVNNLITEKDIAFFKKFFTGFAVLNISGIERVYPKYAHYPRRGKIRASYPKIIPFKSLVKTSDSDLAKLITKILTEDHIQKPVKSKKRAEYLERSLYICPKCHSTCKLFTNDSVISCKTCDLHVYLNSNLTLDDPNVSSIKAWEAFQDDYIKKQVYNNDEPIFSDNMVDVYELAELRKAELIKKGSLTLTKTFLKLKDMKIDIMFYLDKILDVKLNCYGGIYFRTKDKHYLVKGDKRFNALKYVKYIKFLKDGGQNA